MFFISPHDISLLLVLVPHYTTTAVTAFEVLLYVTRFGIRIASACGESKRGIIILSSFGNNRRNSPLAAHLR